ncbi:hypothetical protein EDC01DRAFT_725533 [Geopyxis carbonaria]|nr:hypothetical protein EDC01DRAFT_725533 [Geopyxis carbonaria]
MLALRTRAAAGRLGPLVTRRHASHGPADAHHAPAAHGPAAEEGFSKGFFISLAVALGGLAFYQYDTAGQRPSIVTRLIAQYHSRHEVWEARNVLHTTMVEEAARDKSLLQDYRPAYTIPIRFPEVFNGGSPYNNEAGWATGELGAVKKHLEAEHKKYVPTTLRN